MVAVAQLVESRIVIPVVVGSSPISHPKQKSKKACNFQLQAFLLGVWQVIAAPELRLF
jgi:hypothetical protein